MVIYIKDTLSVFERKVQKVEILVGAVYVDQNTADALKVLNISSRAIELEFVGDKNGRTIIYELEDFVHWVETGEMVYDGMNW